ncbi:MAG TPA: hypothetical protein P5023_03285, partial [Bacteroidales bacterium]|nr:hypothetical protein [Bacteroidales bacterium]
RLFFKILITCHLQQTPTGAGGGRGLSTKLLLFLHHKPEPVTPVGVCCKLLIFRHINLQFKTKIKNK